MLQHYQLGYIVLSQLDVTARYSFDSHMGQLKQQLETVCQKVIMIGLES